MTDFPRMISFNRLLAFLRQRPQRKNDAKTPWDVASVGGAAWGGFFMSRKKRLRLHCTHFNGVVVIAGIGSFFSDMSLQNVWNLQQKFRKKIISEIFLRFIHTSVTKKRWISGMGPTISIHILYAISGWMELFMPEATTWVTPRGTPNNPWVFLMVVSIRWCSPNNYIKFILVGISTMKPSHLKKMGCLG